ncbi:uncharacterized protein LOC141648855 [Silene latifolia]|uniref:uncharacterized protein LOC141648855 n=1 Tax=Silene latifolia TaxID=37657 RepID=UPI003D77C2C5
MGVALWRQLHGVRSSVADVKKISVADGLMATHKEEPEEDASSNQTSSDQNQSSAAGHDKSAIDLLKGALPQAGPPGFTKPVERENRHVTETVSTSVTCNGGIPVHLIIKELPRMQLLGQIQLSKLRRLTKYDFSCLHNAVIRNHKLQASKNKMLYYNLCFKVCKTCTIIHSTLFMAANLNLYP